MLEQVDVHAGIGTAWHWPPAAHAGHTVFAARSAIAKKDGGRRLVYYSSSLSGVEYHLKKYPAWVGIGRCINLSLNIAGPNVRGPSRIGP